MKRISFLIPFSIASFAALGVTRGDDKVVVQSVNYPLHYFAWRLATGDFELHFLVDADVDPAFWKPSDEAILEFQRADLILRNGADYEKWMANLSLPKGNQCNTSEAFAGSLIKTKGEEHRHGDGTVHSHAGTAFTTWIDFSQARSQAEAIAERFKILRPDASAQIDAQLDSLRKDLSALDERMKAFGEAWGERPLVASHPIYQYAARAYGLKIESLEWEPAMEMTNKAMEDLGNVLASHPAKWMIWEDEPTPANADAIAAIGLGSVVFSPCANVPASGDWLEEMHRNLDRIEGLLQKTE